MQLTKINKVNEKQDMM